MTGKTNWIGKAVVLFSVMASLAGALQSAAQTPGDWTWTDGSSTIGTTCYSSSYPCGQLGVYGTKGILASANVPGSRTDAMSWTDTTGRKWLFGGFGYGAAAGSLGDQNDLWQSNAAGTAWEWVSGSNSPGHPGVYGTVGTPAAANVPGGRQDAVTWTDNIGNLWIFGGLGYDGSGTSAGDGYENDLWMYNPTTNQWTWESGSSTVPPYTTDPQLGSTTFGSSPGVYGTLGTGASANTPGGRTNAMAWTDASGNLWMFGGGYSNFDGIFTTYTLYNDLWEFNTSTKQWIWQGGSNTKNGSGSYGTMGTAAASNTPGARYQGGTWKDPSGNFWLFGGYGYDFQGNAAGLDDLWQFNISTKQWTWESGAKNVNTCGNFLFGFYACEQAGNYGTQGTAAGANLPGGRTLFVTWTDTAGNFWLFGGSGADANNSEGWLNDLWKFNPTTPNAVTSTNGEWTWVGGSSTRPTCTASASGGSCGAPGVYGTLGTAASANMPGARQSAVSWTDQTGNFWLFSGWGDDSASTTGYLNDMWQYQPSVSSGNSGTPTLTISPASVPFGNQAVNTTSSATTLLVTNTSSTAISFTGFSFTGTNPTAFTQATGATNPCGATLAASATCNLAVTFTPTAATGYSALFNVADNATGSPQQIALSGTGTTTSVAQAVLSPTSVAFPNTQVSVTSASQSITLSNPGTATLTGIAISIAGANPADFGQTSTCGTTLAASATCNILVTFTPASATAFNGTLSVASSVATQTASLTGTGTAAQASLTPTILTFAPTTVNTTTAAQTITLSNPGNAALTNIGVSITGANPTDFAQTTTCGASLAASSSCTISVTFTPLSATTFGATVSVATSAGTQTTALTGTGTAAAAAQAVLTPSTFTFASTTVAATSSGQVFTLSNPGTATLTGIAVSITGANPTDFAQTTTCGATLAAAGSCTISVTFTPAAAQTYTANVSVANSIATQTATLSGTGTAAPVAQAVLSSTTFTFPSTTVATTSSAQVFTLSNPGTATLTGIAVSIAGANPADFTQTTTCGATLAAAGSCTISVKFAPASAATFTGTLSVASSVATQTATLSGTGTAAPVAQAVLTPSTFTFASTTVATTSAAQVFTLSNPGTAALTGIAVSVAGANPTDFAQTTTCGATLAAAGSCTISVTFTPASAATFTGTLSIANSVATQTATLSGAGTAAATAQAVLTPSTFTFTSTTVATTSAAQTFTLSNPGTATLTGIAISLSGANPTDFAQTTTCGATLAAGSSCTVSVTFTPASAATFTGTLSIANSVATQTATLSGTGTAAPTAQATLTPNTFTFASTTLGTTSAAQTFTLSNPGTATLTGIAISLTGANPTDFAQTTTCGATLAAAGSCTISVTFTPASAATFNGTLSVANSIATQTASLSGTGTSVPIAQAVLSPTTYTFASTSVATTSAAQVFTLSNPGTATLTGIAVSLTGSNPTSFAETTTCGTSLAAAASCTISVTFAPASAATFSAAISVTDNASGSPQTASLNGTGTALAPSFTITSPTSTQSVTAGSAATYTISVSPQNGAFNTPITFSVSGLPAGATATFNPATLTPGSTATSTTLTITTPLTALLQRPFGLPSGTRPISLAVLVLLFLPGKRHRRKVWLGLMLMVSLGGITILSGCGGGFALPGPGSATYNITVTAQGGSVQQTTILQLTVKQ